MAATALVLKRGDTLLVSALYKDSEGNPVDLDAAGITIRSAIRSADGLTRVSLEVTPADQSTNPGEYEIRGDSANWPIGTVAWDIRYTNEDGYSFASETVQLLVAEAVSQ